MTANGVTCVVGEGDIVYPLVTSTQIAGKGIATWLKLSEIWPDWPDRARSKDEKESLFGAEATGRLCSTDGCSEKGFLAQIRRHYQLYRLEVTCPKHLKDQRAFEDTDWHWVLDCYACSLWELGLERSGGIAHQRFTDETPIVRCTSHDKQFKGSDTDVLHVFTGQRCEYA